MRHQFGSKIDLLPRARTDRAWKSAPGRRKFGSSPGGLKEPSRGNDWSSRPSIAPSRRTTSVSGRPRVADPGGDVGGTRQAPGDLQSGDAPPAAGRPPDASYRPKQPDEEQIVDPRMHHLGMERRLHDRSRRFSGARLEYIDRPPEQNFENDVVTAAQADAVTQRRARNVDGEIAGRIAAADRHAGVATKMHHAASLIMLPASGAKPGR
jgi:hypothetical protein